MLVYIFILFCYQEHSSTAGDLVKSEIKAKSVTVILEQVLRDSSRKKNGKNNVSIVSKKHTVDRILSSKHATIASHASKKETHSKVTTPRPFAFATGKQAVASFSASARYDTKKILLSSSLPPKNINSKVWLVATIDSSFYLSHLGFLLPDFVS